MKIEEIRQRGEQLYFELRAMNGTFVGQTLIIAAMLNAYEQGKAESAALLSEKEKELGEVKEEFRNEQFQLNIAQLQLTQAQERAAKAESELSSLRSPAPMSAREHAERVMRRATCTHEGCKTIDILRGNIVRFALEELEAYASQRQPSEPAKTGVMYDATINGEKGQVMFFDPEVAAKYRVESARQPSVSEDIEASNLRSRMLGICEGFAAAKSDPVSEERLQKIVADSRTLFYDDKVPFDQVIWQALRTTLNPAPPTPTRNSEALASFVAYCGDHPGERFWQALRNWSKWHYIFGSNLGSGSDGLVDTFNIEGLDGTRRTPAPPTNGWISVKARLPGVCELVTGWNGVQMHQMFRGSDGEFHYCITGDIASGVIKWQPLPAPPTEGAAPSTEKKETR